MQYIRNMSNNADTGLSVARQPFVDAVARLLIPWGVPQAAARLYGYLLRCEAPVTLDRIAADLEMSKSTASVAARLLEMYTVARRRGARGSKRVLFEASDNYEGMLTAQNGLLQSMANVLGGGARDLPPRRARERLAEMSTFYLAVRDAMDSALVAWRESKRGADA